VPFVCCELSDTELSGRSMATLSCLLLLLLLLLDSMTVAGRDLRPCLTSASQLKDDERISRRAAVHVKLAHRQPPRSSCTSHSAKRIERSSEGIMDLERPGSIY
jgi:hypothetical protein